MGLGNNSRRSNGRTLLDFIGKDLELAARPLSYPSPPGGPSSLQFVANVTSASSGSNPTLIPSADMNPHAFFWQAPIAANTNMGNLGEIGYFVTWDSTSHPGVAKAQLCRFCVDPAAASSSVTNSNYSIYPSPGSSPSNWLSSSLIGAVAPASAPSFEGWFADDVIALWGRCLDDQGNPLIQSQANPYAYDSKLSYTDTNSVVHPPPAFPAMVEFAIVTVDARTAQRIHTPILATASNPANFFKEIDAFMQSLPANVKPGARLYTTRVKLLNE
jgi:hypothetical protein